MLLITRYDWAIPIIASLFKSNKVELVEVVVINVANTAVMLVLVLSALHCQEEMFIF